MKELFVGWKAINSRVVDTTKQGYEEVMKYFGIKLIGFIHEFRRLISEWEYFYEVKLIMLIMMIDRKR